MDVANIWKIEIDSIHLISTDFVLTIEKTGLDGDRGVGERLKRSMSNRKEEVKTKC